MWVPFYAGPPFPSLPRGHQSTLFIGVTCKAAVRGCVYNSQIHKNSNDCCYLLNACYVAGTVLSSVPWIISLKHSNNLVILSPFTDEEIETSRE